MELLRDSNFCKWCFDLHFQSQVKSVFFVAGHNGIIVVENLIKLVQIWQIYKQNYEISHYDIYL